MLSRAQIQRDYRARRSAGVTLLRVPVSDVFGLALALLDTGRLAEWDAEDPTAVAIAVGQLLSDYEGCVTGNGVEVVPRAKARDGSTGEAEANVRPRQPNARR
jgi:hypothetical protein